ncbi:MAG TPA: acyltransferase, partial [Puia sp.]|nr:acyltransferase [Puia sp.]
MEQDLGLIDHTRHKKFYGLDHLRALAITIVLLFHYQIFKHPGWIAKAGKFGWTGVDLFFVLSGYLIASQLFATMAKRKQISFPEFFIKRFFRIIPAYLVVVAVYFCVPAFREREALSPLWRFLTFTQNFHLDLRSSGTFSHSWSLCIEEQFYL